MTGKKQTLVWLAASIWLLFASASGAATYRDLDQQQLWYLELDTGRVVIELNDTFAPKTVAQIKQLTRAGIYDGVSFYRVIDGFVAQAGPGDTPLSDSAIKRLGQTSIPTLPMESVLPWSNARAFTPVQRQDLFAPQTAFSAGFAVGLNATSSEAWLLHCPGAVGIARGNEPDSATSDFYVVIGQAPRYLDGIMTVFGRVVWGMDKVQAILRADPQGSGVMAPDEPQTRIQRAVLGSDLPPEQQLMLAVERTVGEAFEQKLAARKLRDHPFFFKRPPAVLDACQVPIAVQLGT
ncbi:peptidylprolyl isomerase [Simiduia aestuariiviva]|uniref:peptidylprolyl isomerase n=1 Tax=Simiduia aestuariiviva TaxID=1510459 RepID=A0A839UQG2_9GAMM|nr:peptidylprolyl isomerase [Simiduia aestuariiviva]MBB3168719.1 peptidylprolyl isomerase [Simiduia aestuariiviva]